MTSAPPHVAFETRPAAGGPATGCSYILVTPDGERTMNTYLGAAQELLPDDIDAAQVAASRILYLEGYLWDPKSAKEAFVKASTIAHGAGRQVALTLSDAFCVDRYRGEFLDLMRNGTVDLVFANEAELHSLYQTSDFDTALKQFQRRHPRSGWSPAARRAAWWRRKTASSRYRPFRSKRSWTPPAPATCLPPASCSAWCATPVMKTPAASARWQRPKSSSTSAPGRRSR